VRPAPLACGADHVGESLGPMHVVAGLVALACPRER
jgi:hypothetical protein